MESKDLVKGKWYGTIKSAFRFNGEYDNEGLPCGYGLNYLDIWMEEESKGWFNYEGDWKEITPEEIREILEKEAKRRGLGIGIKTHADGEVNEDGDRWLPEYNPDLDYLFLKTGLAYKKGKWAKPVEISGIEKLTTIEEFPNNPITPSHYKSDFDVITFCAKNDVGFLEGNVIKYVVRHQEKNGLEDINKAIEYLNRIKSEYYEK